MQNLATLVGNDKAEMHQELLVKLLRSKWQYVHSKLCAGHFVLHESVGRRNLNLDLPDIWNYQFADVLPALQDRNSGTILYHNG